MKNVNEMSYEELKAEVKNIVSLLDEQPGHHKAYLAELTEALAQKAIEL